MLKQAYVVGNLNVDLVMGNFDGWPEVGSEVTGDFFDFRYAGAAGNSALALRKLGFETHVISALGDDEFGKNFVRAFEKKGIDLSRCKIGIGRTSVSVGISTQDERTFFTFLGSLSDLDNDFFFEKVKDIHRSWILICGFNLISAFREERFAEIVKLMKFNENEILFDPGWPPDGWTEKTTKQALQIAKLSDWFTPNLKEALAISKKSSLKDSLIFFKDHDIHNCIVKLGENGAQGFIGDDVILTPAFHFGKIKDTVGAGDMFNAALLKGLSLRWEKTKVAEFASFYASLGITRIGENRYPAFDEAYRRFLKKRKARENKWNV